MQEPIEFTLHRKLKAKDFAAALALSEELVKRLLYSKWEAGDALAIERKARPQAIAEDVPLPLEEEPTKIIELPEAAELRKTVEKPESTSPRKKPSVAKKAANKDALGKPFVSLHEMMNGALAQQLAVKAFCKQHGGRKPLDQGELAAFLGFSSARNIAPLNRRATMRSHYAEYLSKVLGPQILDVSTTG